MEKRCLDLRPTNYKSGDPTARPRRVQQKEKFNSFPPKVAYVRRKYRSCFYDLPLSFNLSYKVTMTCKWKPSLQPTNRINLPIFTAYHQFVLATKLKMPSFRLKNNTKITHFYRKFLIQIFVQNKKSIFTANLNVRPWYLTGSFPLNVFRGLYISHFIRPSLAYPKLPLSRPKRILGNPAIRRA